MLGRSAGAAAVVLVLLSVVVVVLAAAGGVIVLVAAWPAGAVDGPAAAGEAGAVVAWPAAGAVVDEGDAEDWASTAPARVMPETAAMTSLRVALISLNS